MRRTRYLTIAILAIWAGCLGAATEAADVDGVNEPGASECGVNSDCVPAGSSCCDCPTHAVPVSSGWNNACEDVQCGDPAGSCAATQAVCQSGACVLQCAPVECNTTCENGFVQDSFGCLTCECAGTAPPATAQCGQDQDCVRVAADCCGCVNGGADTAVPSSQVDAYLSGLGCTPSPACPGVDVCEPELVPRCLNNTCVLLSQPSGSFTPDAGAGGGGGQAYCGAADLPPCPEGQTCVLNSPDAEDANMNGLGVCQAP